VFLGADFEAIGSVFEGGIRGWVSRKLGQILRYLYELKGDKRSYLKVIDIIIT
jgi:hypothetical protein